MSGIEGGREVLMGFFFFLLFFFFPFSFEVGMRRGGRAGRAGLKLVVGGEEWRVFSIHTLGWWVCGRGYCMVEGGLDGDGEDGDDD